MPSPEMKAQAIKESAETVIIAAGGLFAGHTIAEYQAVIGLLVSVATLLWIVLRIIKLIRPDKFHKTKEEE